MPRNKFKPELRESPVASCLLPLEKGRQSLSDQPPGELAEAETQAKKKTSCYLKPLIAGVICYASKGEQWHIFWRL